MNNEKISFEAMLIANPQIREVQTQNGKKYVVSLFVSYYDNSTKSRQKANVSVFFDQDKKWASEKLLGEYKNHDIAILNATRREDRVSEYNGEQQTTHQYSAWGAVVGVHKKDWDAPKQESAVFATPDLSDDDLPF